MREVFAQTIRDPRFSIADGTFEKSANVPDGWADVVFGATAFHWTRDYVAAVKELNRVLKPDGVVIFIWQLEDRDTDGWAKDMWELGDVYQHQTGNYKTHFMDWPFHDVFNTDEYKQHFKAPEKEHIDYYSEGTDDIVIARFKTWSKIASLEPQKQSEVAQQLKDVLTSRADTKQWLDKEKGTFKVPMHTPVITIRRVSQ
ncbi:hypothetical protein EIP91_008813 [Steccherinum ochraceum]|uniref:Methyltransferase type 11 domain-containing protein n=1 Tax=Steccherinum ochraceum TaxID=92696 RepID=A0A4R0RC80_9APHY|nr:hypothetical protein EIP91_008813 [Steccherinum ochraceum]